MTATAPATSSRARDSRYPCSSVSQASAAAIAATPIGMFTNSTQRQPRAEVSTPPRIEPAAPPAPATALQMPRARARRSPVNVVTMMVSVAGDRQAPATPCTARAAVSQAESVASPPARLASVNRPIPNR